MPVEFLGIAATNDGSEITARSGAIFDKEYTLRLARAHEENGWDRVLFAYGSNAPDPNIGAAYIASKTEALQLLLAHRPNVSYPTFAAKTFATVDQVSDGRVTVHFITGGTDHEQQREGDYLTKDERYERTRECMQIVKLAWTSREAFDYQGKHYKFADFVSDVFPVRQPRPGLSFGGSSPAAYQAGGAEADIYCLWGEPLARTRAARTRPGSRWRSARSSRRPRRGPGRRRMTPSRASRPGWRPAAGH
jgi:alkanesulfonate monooxygenase